MSLLTAVRNNPLIVIPLEKGIYWYKKRLPFEPAERANVGPNSPAPQAQKEIFL